MASPKNLPALRLDPDQLGPAMLALSPSEQVFVYSVVFGGLNQSDAAKAGGYSDANRNTLGAQGSRMAHTRNVPKWRGRFPFMPKAVSDSVKDDD